MCLHISGVLPLSVYLIYPTQKIFAPGLGAFLSAPHFLTRFTPFRLSRPVYPYSSTHTVGLFTLLTLHLHISTDKPSSYATPNNPVSHDTPQTVRRRSHRLINKLRSHLCSYAPAPSPSLVCLVFSCICPVVSSSTWSATSTDLALCQSL